MMEPAEAVALLLAVANVGPHSYDRKPSPGSVWPPPQAFAIVDECGLLPIGVTMAAQVVRWWGKGWEAEVLPLLQQHHGQALRSQKGNSGYTMHATLEERVVKQGIDSIAGEDAPAVRQLFRMFGVTMAGYVHSLLVVELLWKACCTPEAMAQMSAGKQKQQYAQQPLQPQRHFLSGPLGIGAILGQPVSLAGWPSRLD